MGLMPLLTDSDRLLAAVVESSAESSTDGTRRLVTSTPGPANAWYQRASAVSARSGTPPETDRTQEVGGSSPPSSILEAPVLEPSLGSGAARSGAAARAGVKQESSTGPAVAEHGT